MKIFSAEQIRQWDAFTIDNEPITSIDLMERAAAACFTWLTDHFQHTAVFMIFCGTGNNGGDGLAIARMLLLAGHTVDVYILEGGKRSADFTDNFDRINSLSANLQFINIVDLPVIPTSTIIIDALFGTGSNKPLEGPAAELVKHINNSGNQVISIDMPSGLFADSSSAGNVIVTASHTLSFQTSKLAFMLAENNIYTGKVHVLDIGLHPQFYEETTTVFQTVGKKMARSICKPRNQHFHKYNFGHALLFTGSKNMMGAAILCARACLRSGAGLVTVYTEDGTQGVIQAALPEAIATTDRDLPTVAHKKSAIGIGPGLLPSDENKNLLNELIKEYNGALVIDATALSLLSGDVSILQQRMSNPAVLTPHSGEFDKLFGKASGDFERMTMALEQAKKHGAYIILKGHRTLIACPDGTALFNTTGNAGMATAGSGDTLTGILTGLLAQSYSQRDACILGVYLHGMAGDIAAKKMSQEAMIAGDIIDHIGAAYKKIKLAE